ncbi:GTP cyclohydrolase IIa [Halomicrobium urmianum]|uniref:GTP cyclohydrolase IIa n=1 Tax=Halomicrobium urmianum TaxID=1586233 RepID=UPI001CD9A5E3|nr:GTP cyclohydrolase IIa [Halomicrobium urmianum]
MIQATLFQLDNYGPWTTTPAPRREMDLQTLQSRLYADVASAVGRHDGYAFYTRGDNIVAFTGGMDREDHRALQRTVRNRYPVTLSAGIGGSETPQAAVADATERLQAAGSAQDADRTEVLRGDPVDAGGEFHVAHYDVVDATGRYTDSRDAFGTYLTVSRVYAAVAEKLYREDDALAFFVGGDNVIAVCPALSRSTYRDHVDAVAEETGVELRVGVGAGTRAVEAGSTAKEALELAREDDVSVVSGTDEAVEART